MLLPQVQLGIHGRLAQVVPFVRASVPALQIPIADNKTHPSQEKRTWAGGGRACRPPTGIITWNILLPPQDAFPPGITLLHVRHQIRNRAGLKE
jgi:hypothetical protein